MTSARKLMANRANARKSTGPKTPAGKARSSRNAWRHGLSIEMPRDVGWSQGVEQLARLIAGPNASPERFQRACVVADIQRSLDLVRIASRKMQEVLYAGRLADNPDPAGLKEFDCKLLAQLSRIDRYETRMLARRRFAMRAYSKLHTLPPHAKEKAADDFLQNEAKM